MCLPISSLAMNKERTEQLPCFQARVHVVEVTAELSPGGFGLGNGLKSSQASTSVGLLQHLQHSVNAESS
jgi:hypothetical protein